MISHTIHAAAVYLLMFILISDSHDYKSELLSLCSALTPHISSNNNHLNTIISISKKCLSDRSSTLRAMSLLTMSDVIKHGCSGLLFEDSLGMQVCKG